MKKIVLVSCTMASLFLAACGGGGDGEPAASSTTAPPPAPVASLSCPDSYKKITGTIPNASLSLTAGDEAGNDFGKLTLKTSSLPVPSAVEPENKVCFGKLTSLPAGAVGDVAYDVRATDFFESATDRQVQITVPTAGILPSNPTVYFYTLDGSGNAVAASLASSPSFNIVDGKVTATVAAGLPGLYTVKLP
ncbi:hypothetical protein [Imbroritus primus]|uniref:hypothetical protein n=1 Tax=Imbroritus primus TaxID=3058603 RepID=UPI003D161886